LKLLYPTDLTFVAWVHITDLSNTNVLSGLANTSQQGWMIQIDASGRLILTYKGSNSSSDINLVTTNDWIQVAVVQHTADGRADFYKNGSPFTLNKYRHYTIEDPGARPFIIGIDARDESGYELNGQIDNVMIFDRALTAEEIAWLYNRGRP